MKPRTLPGCMCSPELGFTCSLHRGDPTAYAKEEADALEFDNHETPNLRDKEICRSQVSDECPWNPDELPDRLKGFGHRGADQDGFSGSEWVTPQEDFEGQMIEAVKVLFDGREI